MELSPEQQFAFDTFKQGKNIFITGPGGTGKSFLIKQMVKWSSINGKRISVCALTGCAAVLLECNAKTIHSWSSIGLGKTPVDKLAYRISRNSKKLYKWKNTDILIVDEVSMMSKKIFELLDSLGKTLRHNDKPFGGIQLVFSGDFFQLPPVGDKDDDETRQFCFESPLWKRTFEEEIQLKSIFRQKDPIYSKILNQIRVGAITKKSFALLQEYVMRPKSEDSEVEPTILYPTRHFVDKKNKTSLDKLEGDVSTYTLTSVAPELLNLTDKEKEIANKFSVEEIESERKQLIGSANVEKEISLKVGAQVMCTVNLEMDSSQPICNGSQGIVVGFTPASNYPIVRFHNGVERIIEPFVWKSETIPSVAFKQVPLILAWALTIHKSQGATLDLAEIDVGHGVFECGQTYVALSRVKSLDGLYLKSFNPFKIKINAKVKKYYKELRS